MQLFHDLIHDYTLRSVALGVAILGIVNGALGAFAVLRKQSLLGDTISHSALPGIALAFMAAQTKQPLSIMVGAGLAGWVGTYFVLSIIHHTRVKEDSALGIVLSVFFGVGVILIKVIERTMPNSEMAGLDKILFGQTASLMVKDVVIMGTLGVVVLAVLLLFWKEFSIMTFNPEFGQSLGYPKKRLDILLVSLIVISIVIGLQAVGVVLMSAVIVIPATAARQWTNRLGAMVCLSAAFGAIAGVGGTLVSSAATLPPGPTIVLALAAIITLSLLVAPDRGVIWKLIQRQRNKRRFHLDGILIDLYRLSMHHDDFDYKHSIRTLQTMRPNKEGVGNGLKFLAEKGWVEDAANGFWALTKEGWERARTIENNEEEPDHE